jgi:hypothetical protein
MSPANGVLLAELDPPSFTAYMRSSRTRDFIPRAVAVLIRLLISTRRQVEPDPPTLEVDKMPFASHDWLPGCWFGGALIKLMSRRLR